MPVVAIRVPFGVHVGMGRALRVAVVMIGESGRGQQTKGKRELGEQQPHYGHPCQHGFPGGCS